MNERDVINGDDSQSDSGIENNKTYKNENNKTYKNDNNESDTDSDSEERDEGRHSSDIEKHDTLQDEHDTEKNWPCVIFEACQCMLRINISKTRPLLP